MKEKTVRFQRYLVAGNTAFPMEMLWVDEAFPLSVVDARKIGKLKPSNDDEYVELGRYSTNKKNRPRIKLWNKFGWRVLKYSVQTLN